MRKSPDAFRTISEVAQDLDLPQHVLRFWETRFSQIKPMKRGGGRRYYRPDDIDLLKGIRHLLYDEGYTIKGVQRILKEQGVRFVIDTIAETEDIAQQLPDGAAAGETDAPQQDYSEPNQLELTRPPLVAPRAGAPLAPHANASASPAHPTPPPQATQVSVQASAAPMQTAAGAYTVPEATAAGHVAEASLSPKPNQATPTIQSIQSAQTVSLPVHSDAPPSQAAPQPASGFTPQTHGQIHQAPSNLNNQAAPTTPEIAVAPTAQAANWQEQPPVQAPQVPKANATHAMQEPQQAAPMPRDLSGGDPKFLSGESASISVSDAERVLAEQNSGTGLFNRLRGRADDAAKTEKAKSGMARDDIRRLQSTLFELLECKRILDHARSDGSRD